MPVSTGGSDQWQTSDGNKFGSMGEAQIHEDNINSGKNWTTPSPSTPSETSGKSSASDIADNYGKVGNSSGYSESQKAAFAAGDIRYQEGLMEKYVNPVVNAYNAKNWDAVIAGVNKAMSETSGHTHNIMFYYPTLQLRKMIAQAEKGDWEDTLKASRHLSTEGILNNRQAYAELIPVAQNAAMRAWERAHGRKMTEAEINSLLKKEDVSAKIKEIERAIFVARNNPDAATSWVKSWEELTGREMTKADEIRIADKPFIKRGLFGKKK